MRVIAGKYKGKILKSPTSNNIRPTEDMVKQALFTKLQFEIAGGVVLDLFCGSGALGIEAISRGADFVCFVDKDKRSIALTKENLRNISEEYRVLNCSYDIALKNLDYKFDLILIDPPYASGLYDNALKLIYEYNLLTDGGTIVCEHPCGMQLSSNFEIYDQKKYGTVTLTYLKNKTT